jgi:MSHA biogenesis protein MshK
MVEHLSKALKAVTIAGLHAMALLSACGGAFAQMLPDPTRPPASLGSDADAASGKPAGGPELQSVLISPARKMAIISGQTVLLGEKYGEARLVKITETEVTLRSGTDLQVLRLFPGLDKKSASGQTTGKSDKRQQ